MRAIAFSHSCSRVLQLLSLRTASTLRAADPATATAAATASEEGVCSSLSEAARQPHKVRQLDLSASQQLLCTNLLCDKVGDPCLCRISRVLEQLTAVEELYLRGNRLVELPASVWGLPSLRHLDLSDNQLAAIPEDIAGLESLEVLRLTGNNPDLRLPYAALVSLPQLRRLEVDKPLRHVMMLDPAAVRLLHWLHF